MNDAVVRLVVRYVGWIAVILSIGAVVMFYAVLVESRAKAALDPAVVGLFGTLTTLAATAVSGLTGFVLGSRAAGEVEVVNAPTEPVPVAPAAPAVEVPQPEAPGV